MQHIQPLQDEPDAAGEERDVDDRFHASSEESADRIGDLIASQQALVLAIGSLAESIALLAQAMSGDEVPQSGGGTLDD